MTPCLLFPFECRPAAANMACDDVLLSIAEAAAAPALRFYEWSAATLSLGYFQPLAERALHPASAACPVVRRASGGGAIVHDREVTYALALPRAHALARRAADLYAAVHESLVAALASWHVTASLAVGARSLGREPFLCFQRRAAGDVLVGNEKVCGSAQRRQRSALVQHGSLLLARSPRAPELPGLAEIVGRAADAETLAEGWRAEMAARLGWTFQTKRWSRQQLEMVDRIEAAKYAQSAWTARR